MKLAVKISRIVTCVAVTLYTIFVCYLCGQSVYYFTFRILKADSGAYYSEVSSVPPEAVPHIVVGVALLLLGAASIVLMFRRGRLSACLSGGAAVACAVLGMCIDTMLAEVMFVRYKLGIADLDAWLYVKPMAAYLCICAAVVYIVLYLVAYRKQK